MRMAGNRRIGQTISTTPGKRPKIKLIGRKSMSEDELSMFEEFLESIISSILNEESIWILYYFIKSDKNH